MAYPDPFDVLTPTGGEAKSQGDDRIREMKRGILQRLNTFFANFGTSADPITDPVVPKAGIIAESHLAAAFRDKLLHEESYTYVPYQGAIGVRGSVSVLIPVAASVEPDDVLITSMSEPTGQMVFVVLNAVYVAPLEVRVYFYNPSDVAINVTTNAATWRLLVLRPLT